MTTQRFDIDRFHPLFQRALRLEADAEELLAHTTGVVPYWGLIRLPLMIQLIDRARNENNAQDIYLKPREFEIARVLSYTAKSLWRSPFRHANREIVFFCSGVNKTLANGAYFNSRVDYFVDALRHRKILLVEGAYDLRYAWPRARGPVSFKGGLTVPAAAWSRFRRPRADEEGAVRAFMALLKSGLEGALTTGHFDVLEQSLRRSIGRSQASYVTSCRLLDRLRPRVVFVENAHCGGDIELIAAARERGITTVEYQHGAIIPFCPHHNFHPNLLAAGYGKHLPDYFLAYGDYWTSFLTTTAKVLSIGNPHVTTVASQLKSTPPTKSSVYFLSSANDPEKYMARMLELRAEGFSVTFRPHPVERPLLEQRYGSFFRNNGIEVDVGADLFALVPRHEFVIGDWNSTSLFEAFAIAAERVFVMEMAEHLTHELPQHDFLRTLKSAKELRRIAAGTGDDIPVSVDRIFAPNWQERFSSFMSSLLPA